jgi:hypothetical protein
VGAPTVAVLNRCCGTVGEAVDIVKGQRMPQVARHMTSPRRVLSSLCGCLRHLLTDVSDRSLRPCRHLLSHLQRQRLCVALLPLLLE